MNSTDYYDAGVYCIKSLRTGDSYVGSSCRLAERIKTHVANIFSKTGRKSLFRGLCKHEPQDIEIRVLERVEVRRGASGFIRKDRASAPGRKLLAQREKHWIRAIRPTLNTHNNRPIVGIDIPVQEPEQQQASQPSRDGLAQSA